MKALKKMAVVLVPFCAVLVVMGGRDGLHHAKEIAWVKSTHPEVVGVFERFKQLSHSTPRSLQTNSLALSVALATAASDKNCPEDYKAQLLAASNSAIRLKQAAATIPTDSAELIVYGLVAAATEALAGQDVRQQLDARVGGAADEAYSELLREEQKLNAVATEYTRTAS